MGDGASKVEVVRLLRFPVGSLQGELVLRAEIWSDGFFKHRVIEHEPSASNDVVIGQDMGHLDLLVSDGCV